MPAAIPIMIALTAVGTATSVVGQIKAGNAAKRAGIAGQEASESEAQLAEYNAEVADLQAKDAELRGVEEAGRFRSQVRGLIGSQRAGFAAGNVDVSYGTPVDVQADAAFLGELDALTIRNNAAREAWGFQVQGEDLRKRAEIARKGGAYQAEAGRVQQSASRWGAATTILGTGSSLLMAKYGFNRRSA